MVHGTKENIRGCKMRKIMLLSISLMILTGCATSKDYTVYVDAQKSISKDITIGETAKVNALVEMTKSADPAVRATGIMLLQQLQQSGKTVNIEPPKKNILGF